MATTLVGIFDHAYTVRERFSITPGGPPPYWLIVLDDVHHIAAESKNLLEHCCKFHRKPRSDLF